MCVFLVVAGGSILNGSHSYVLVVVVISLVVVVIVVVGWLGTVL